MSLAGEAFKGDALVRWSTLIETAQAPVSHLASFQPLYTEAPPAPLNLPLQGGVQQLQQHGTTPNRCFACGQVGHFARVTAWQCSYRGKMSYYS